jgi:hypothetical protein
MMARKVSWGRAIREMSETLSTAVRSSPLYTASPGDFGGAENLIEVIELKARSNNL